MAREAEERERAAKAAKKARQEAEAKMQAPGLSPTAAPVVSAAESTSHEAVDDTGTLTCCSNMLCPDKSMCYLIPKLLLRW